MLELLTDPHAWAALVTLTVLEIVLGIDNVVFISILVSRCDPKQAKRARQIGLSLAMSPHTFRTHLRNIMRKLEARTRAHAVAIAIGDGAIEPPAG